MPDRLKALFRIEELNPMKDAYVDATRKGKRPKEAIEISLQNHVHTINGWPRTNSTPSNHRRTRRGHRAADPRLHQVHLEDHRQLPSVAHR